MVQHAAPLLHGEPLTTYIFIHGEKGIGAAIFLKYNYQSKSSKQQKTENADIVWGWGLE